jgi:predicted PurR-regulated permease PerM
MRTLDATHANFLFLSSHATLIACVYAWYQGFVQHAFMLAVVYLSSIVYWCHQTTGLRRNIDIVLVHVCMLYFFTVSLHCADTIAFRTQFSARFVPFLPRPCT